MTVLAKMKRIKKPTEINAVEAMSINSLMTLFLNLFEQLVQRLMLTTSPPSNKSTECLKNKEKQRKLLRRINIFLGKYF